MASNFSIVTTTQVVEIIADEQVASSTYLTLNVPPVETCPKVKMVQFECESHDQGFASFPERGSFSWGDLVVKTSSGNEVYRKVRAYSNAIANSDYQMHIELYSGDDEIVQKLTPGSVLELVLNAQYPGWANFAKYGRLAIYY